MYLIAQAYFCLFLVCVSWWWLKKKKSKSLAINWPILGMIPSLLANANRIHDFVTDNLKQNGGTYVFKGPWFSGLEVVFTSNAENVHHILSKNFSNYDKGPDYKVIFEALGDGILASYGKNWKMQRKLIHTVFRDRRFELTRERNTINKITKGFFPLLDQASELGKNLDIQDWLKRFMFDTVCDIVLDFDPETLSLSLPESEYAIAFKVIQEVTFYRNMTPKMVWKLKRWLQIGGEKELRNAIKVFNSFIFDRISRKREQLLREGSSAANLEDKFNLLTYLLVEDGQNEDDENPELTRAYRKSDKFLRDTTFNLVAAGRDSVAAGFAWLIWLVATHPLVEEKLLKEMKQVFGERVLSGEKIIPEKDDLDKLIYLHATVLETLRLYPPVPFDQMVPMKEDTLPSGHKISANTVVAYVLYAMGRMEDIWGEDCEEFKPERWIMDSEQGKIKHVPSYKFIAFNAGPRTCVGRELALDQMKTVAAALIWNYRFKVVEGHPIFPNTAVILHIRDGLQINVFKRNGSS